MVMENICGYDTFESIINYNFKDKSLLLQAMTHGSCTNNNFTDDYQKLEFLGDFVLNFLISRHLELETRDSITSPGELSQRRATLISNNDLAWLAVRNSFHHYLRISCPFAKIEIDRFVTMIGKMDKQLDEFNMKIVEEKQNILDAASQNAPKVLAAPKFLK